MEKTIDIEIKKGTRRLAPFLHAAIRPLKQYSKCLEAEKLNKRFSLYGELYRNEKDSRLRRHYMFCLKKVFGKINKPLIEMIPSVSNFISAALMVPNKPL